MNNTTLDHDIIDQLCGGKLGVFDTPCPACGPLKRRGVSQRKPTLRVWRLDPTFATYHCARCGERGHVRDGSTSVRRIDPAAIERVRRESAQREQEAAAERLSKARWLWARRKPVAGSIAEVYLREARGYRGPLPATLGFLPARGGHGPAMIAAFGLASEPEPGGVVLADTELLRGVHITRLAADGSGKAGTDADKIMIGRSAGWPIVLAPVNDLGGLAICEGIEDALSAVAGGFGAWASGSAGRMPALADVVPSYVEAVTVFADDDDTGRRNARELAVRLRDRGFETRVKILSVKFREKAVAA